MKCLKCDLKIEGAYYAQSSITSREAPKVYCSLNCAAYGEANTVTPPLPVSDVTASTDPEPKPKKVKKKVKKE